jgi:putative ATPase
VESTPKGEAGAFIFSLQDAPESIQKESSALDKNADEPYDPISAFHQIVMRGSDLMRRCPGGEELYAGRTRPLHPAPLLIWRGSIIGQADPRRYRWRLRQAYAFEYVGLPEGGFPP